MIVVRRLLGVRVGEGRRAALMAAHVFLVTASLLVVKPASNALFLSRFGAAALPQAYLVVALAAAVATLLFSWSLPRASIGRLIRLNLAVGALALVVFRVLLGLPGVRDATLYGLYGWVGTWGLGAGSMFWVLANAVFDAREAKRLFGLLGSGAIAGAISGGYLASILATTLGPENLLLLAAGLQAACWFVTGRVLFRWRQVGGEAKHRPPLAADGVLGTLREMSASRHLRLVAGLVGIGALASRLVDFQYSAVAAAAFPDDETLTAFFAFWASTTNGVALILHLTLTRVVIRAFGVRATLFALPVALLVASGTLFVWPGIVAAVALRLADGSLKPSLNKASMELLMIPVPGALKQRAKTLIDVLVDSLATGVGGITLLVIGGVFEADPRGGGVLTLALVAIWLVVLTRVRSAYLESFRDRLAIETERDPDELEARPGGIMASVSDDLTAAPTREIVARLKMLEGVPDGRALSRVPDLLEHPDPGVRAAALRVLSLHGDIDAVAKASALLDAEPDADVTIEIMRYLYARDPEGPGRIAGLLERPTGRLHHAALVCLALEVRDPQARAALAARIQQAVRGIAAIQDAGQRRQARIAVARAIGASGDRELARALRIFLADPDPAVAREAVRAVSVVGEPTLAAQVVQLLTVPGFASDAIACLSNLGDPIVGTLEERLRDPAADPELRRHVPRALGGIGTQRAVDALTRALGESGASQRFEIVRALNRLRRDHPRLRYDFGPVRDRLFQESRIYESTLRVLTLHRSGELVPPEAVANDAGPLRDAEERLARALEQKLDHNLERIFRMLGLHYPPEDMERVYLGLRPTGQTELRAHALEFLDNILESDLKRAIVPLVETSLSGVGSFGDSIADAGPDRRAALARLLRDESPEIRAAAAELVGRSADLDSVTELGELIADPDPDVARTATAALKRLGMLEE